MPSVVPEEMILIGRSRPDDVHFKPGLSLSIRIVDSYGELFFEHSVRVRGDRET